MDGSCRISMSVCLTPSCELYFELLPLESHNGLYIKAQYIHMEMHCKVTLPDHYDFNT